MYSDDNEKNGPSDRLHETGKVAAKQAVKKGIKAAGKATGKLLVKGITVLAGIVGWPVLLMIILFLTLLLLFGAFYSAMPGQGALVGVEPSEHDTEIREYAEGRVSDLNCQETWLVEGEGAWYPEKGGYTLGRLADRFGRDASMMNQWGDIYACVLYRAAQENEDKMQDIEWVKSGLADAAENLRPWFYYKESSVEYCSKDGESHAETVYLLVEAYTIRGHYRWNYRWVTKTNSDGASVKYEEIAGTQRISDGLEYLKKYIVASYDLPTKTKKEQEQAEIAARAAFEMAQGFTAQQENLSWLLRSAGFASYISVVSIPVEYRDALEEASQRTGIPVWFLAGLIEKESSWDPNAVNEKTGCFGLTQLHPDFWPGWAQRYGFDLEGKWDPRAQIIVGAEVLKGYASGFDWFGINISNKIPPAVESALARYGGYGGDVQAAQGYISNVLQLARAYSSGPGAWPTPGYYEITSHFGMRLHPVFKVWKEHTGVDIGAPEGADVISVSGGAVWKVARDEEAWGNCVYVRDARYEYQYAHLSWIAVREGDIVEPGDLIGKVGNTGASTGSHLHFGVRPIGGNWIDPEALLWDLQ